MGKEVDYVQGYRTSNWEGLGLREKGIEKGVLGLNLKEFTRKVTRERMFLAKYVALINMSRPERMCYVQEVESKRKLESSLSGSVIGASRCLGYTP